MTRDLGEITSHRYHLGEKNRETKRRRRKKKKEKMLSEVGFEPTPGEPDCDLNAAPWTARPS